MATYNLWLTNSFGDRIGPLDGVSFFSYSISVHSIGTLQVGIPYKILKDITGGQVFGVDRMIEVWRSPEKGLASKLERIYLLRKVVKYQRKEDGATMVSLYGRDGKDLLNRRYVIQAEGTEYTNKTDYVDDMMKEIVSQQMLFGSALDETGASDNTRAFPEALFTVQGDISSGPSVTYEAANKKVLDVCRELQEISKQKNIEDPTNKKIYWDMVEKMSSSTGKFGFEFQTFEITRGSDRTAGQRYSVDNGNLEGPSDIEEHYDEINVAISKGEGRGEERLVETVEDTNRSGASPWARVETIVSSGATTAAEAQSVGNSALDNNRPIKRLDVTFLSTPGDRNTPRSLYGVDWKVGDLLPVTFLGEYYEVEVKIAYISVNDAGAETITGRTEVGE